MEKIIILRGVSVLIIACILVWMMFVTGVPPAARLVHLYQSIVGLAGTVNVTALPFINVTGVVLLSLRIMSFIVIRNVSD